MMCDMEKPSGTHSDARHTHVDTAGRLGFFFSGHRANSALLSTVRAGVPAAAAARLSAVLF